MADGPDGAGFIFNNETRYAIVDQFRDGAAIEHDNGAPQAMASIITSPKGSGQSIGTIRAMARLKNSDFCASVISPMNSTCGLARSGLIIFSK
jgi:hypothetical protein